MSISLTQSSEEVESTKPVEDKQLSSGDRKILHNAENKQRYSEIFDKAQIQREKLKSGKVDQVMNDVIIPYRKIILPQLESKVGLYYTYSDTKTPQNEFLIPPVEENLPYDGVVLNYNQDFMPDDLSNHIFDRGVLDSQLEQFQDAIKSLSNINSSIENAISQNLYYIEDIKSGIDYVNYFITEQRQKLEIAQNSGESTALLEANIIWGMEFISNSESRILALEESSLYLEEQLLVNNNTINRNQGIVEKYNLVLQKFDEYQMKKFYNNPIIDNLQFAIIESKQNGTDVFASIQKFFPNPTERELIEIVRNITSWGGSNYNYDQAEGISTGSIGINQMTNSIADYLQGEQNDRGGICRDIASFGAQIFDLYGVEAGTTSVSMPGGGHLVTLYNTQNGKVGIIDYGMEYYGSTYEEVKTLYNAKNANLSLSDIISDPWGKPIGVGETFLEKELQNNASVNGDSNMINSSLAESMNTDESMEGNLVANISPQKSLVSYSPSKKTTFDFRNANTEEEGGLTSAGVSYINNSYGGFNLGVKGALQVYIAPKDIVQPYYSNVTPGLTTSYYAGYSKALYNTANVFTSIGASSELTTRSNRTKFNNLGSNQVTRNYINDITHQSAVSFSHLHKLGNFTTSAHIGLNEKTELANYWDAGMLKPFLGRHGGAGISYYSPNSKNYFNLSYNFQKPFGKTINSLKTETKLNNFKLYGSYQEVLPEDGFNRLEIEKKLGINLTFKDRRNAFIQGSEKTEGTKKVRQLQAGVSLDLK